MKFKVLWLFTLISLCNLTFSMEEAILASSDIPVTGKTNDEAIAKKLNKLFSEEFAHLDSINSILQYIAQAINRDSIKVSNKKEVRQWVIDHQKLLGEIEKKFSFPVEEEKLAQLTDILEEFIDHLKFTIENRFQDLEIYNLNTEQSTKKIVDLELIESSICRHSSLISDLKETANRAGLSLTNIVARKLDAFNNKYGITKTLEYLPALCLGGATAMYLTPARYFERIPFLNRCKSFLGTSAYTDPSPEQAAVFAQFNGNNLNAGYFDKMIKLLKSKDFKAFGILATVFPYLTTKQSWHPYTAKIREECRKTWAHLKGFTINDNKTYDVIKDVTLDDEKLVGVESQIEDLRNLVRYITDPEIYDRSNSNLDKGVLLTGPTRCGKTFAARALCGTLNKTLNEKGAHADFKFREIKWGEVKWSSDGIKTLIEQAKRNAPCILFIDEIHNLPLQTKEGGEVLTEFLVGMSGVNSENDARHQVILLAATNQPEMLDSALLQPGRFGTIIRFEKPTYSKREQYFKTVFKLNAINTDKIDIKSLARQTHDCSYGDLEFIVKNARFTARTMAKSVTQEHLQNQINKYVYRIKSECQLTDKEKRILSVHQAGHTLMSILLEPQEKLEAVTIRERWAKIKEGKWWDAKQKAAYKAKHSIYGGFFTFNESELIKLQNNIEKEKLCKIKLAGNLAEKLILGTSGSTVNSKDKNGFHAHDKKKAFKYTKAIILDGFDFKDLPKNKQEQINYQALELLNKYEKETSEILSKNQNLLEQIAKELEEKTILTATDIKNMLNLKQ